MWISHHIALFKVPKKQKIVSQKDKGEKSKSGVNRNFFFLTNHKKAVPKNDKLILSHISVMKYRITPHYFITLQSRESCVTMDILKCP